MYMYIHIPQLLSYRFQAGAQVRVLGSLQQLFDARGLATFCSRCQLEELLRSGINEPRIFWGGFGFRVASINLGFFGFRV